jgi:hypothetical protein
MILRELFYFDRETVEPEENDRYEPQYDKSPYEYTDTRKTKLLLKDINRIRKAAELSKKQKEKELQFVKQMYAMPAGGEEAI